jgi:hypothetical protein
VELAQETAVRAPDAELFVRDIDAAITGLLD